MIIYTEIRGVGVGLLREIAQYFLYDPDTATPAWT